MLTNVSTFCMQQMIRCPPGGPPATCEWGRRQWFCPAGWGGAAFNPRAFRGTGLPVTNVVGRMFAHKPETDYLKWQANWVSVDMQQISDFEIAADLSSLGDAPVHMVRYAWGHQGADRQDDVLCCDRGDEQLFKTKPCKPAACPIVSHVARGGGWGGGGGGLNKRACLVDADGDRRPPRQPLSRLRCRRPVQVHRAAGVRRGERYRRRGVKGGEWGRWRRAVGTPPLTLWMITPIPLCTPPLPHAAVPVL